MSKCDGCNRHRYIGYGCEKRMCCSLQEDINKSYPEDFADKCTCVECIIKAICTIWCKERLELYDREHIKT